MKLNWNNWNLINTTSSYSLLSDQKDSK
uniref:Uncharacterized protein n=1 Tax=Anguilla anguilla TaxID=7936 RepID=A0A0E9UNL1_ANGAN